MIDESDASSTVRLKKENFSLKSVPIICSWCNTIFRVSEWEVSEDKMTRPSNGICDACKKKLKEQANS